MKKAKQCKLRLNEKGRSHTVTRRDETEDNKKSCTAGYVNADIQCAMKTHHIVMGIQCHFYSSPSNIF